MPSLSVCETADLLGFSPQPSPQFSQNGVKNRKHPGSSRSAGHVLCSEMQPREAEQLKTMSDSIPVRLLWTQPSQNYTPRHGETSSLIFFL